MNKFTLFFPNKNSWPAFNKKKKSLVKLKKIKQQIKKKYSNKN